MTTSRSGDSGFLSRWSRRKLQGGADAAPAEPPTALAPADKGLESPVSAHPPPIPAPAVERPPAPTLEELAPLDHTADLTRFIASGVEEGVRRAALRKLFSDPQFNVMDGLDTYIDDYNTPSPVPPGLLARLKLTPNLGLAPPETAAADLGPEQAVAACAMPTRTVPAPAGHAAAPSEQDAQADAPADPSTQPIPPST
ncbi:MAG: DUF3306 domain-containing protein [Thiomonas sp.]